MSAVATVRLGQSLHARPATTLVDAVLTSGARVEIEVPSGQRIDAGGILAVMAADLRAGTTVTVRVRAHDDDAPSALETLTALVALLATEDPDAGD